MRAEARPGGRPCDESGFQASEGKSWEPLIARLEVKYLQELRVKEPGASRIDFSAPPPQPATLDLFKEAIS